MKLPQYDNRPKSGEPLYKSSSSDWDDIKFPVMVIVLVSLLLGSAYMTFAGLADLLRSIFH